MENLLIVWQAVILVVLMGAGMMAFSNLAELRRLGAPGAVHQWPRVSILVPARNEAANIEACIRSLLAQDYPDFEVIVVDDHSTDETGVILGTLAQAHGRLRSLTALPLPHGWFGKHWACHQLTVAAQGEVLLFTDADTVHHPRTLREAVETLSANQADMLTALPQFVIGSWAEALSVPLILQTIFFALPIGLAHRWQRPALSSTVGAFMLFRRRALLEIGGFAAVRQEVLDDVMLGRRMMTRGHRWRIADATQRVRCRMYRTLGQVIEGFSKNMYAAIEHRVGLFISIWAGTLSLFVGPWLLIAADIAGGPVPAQASLLALAAIVLTMGLQLLLVWRFRLPFALVAAYPFLFLFMAMIGVNSMRLSRSGRATWKGRSAPRSTPQAGS